MYEDTAILRKDGTPIYGRKALRGHEKLSSTYVLYAVKVLLVMMSTVACQDRREPLPAAEGLDW